MQDNPTLREVAQAFSVWLTAQTQTAKAWLSSLGDIRIGTIVAVIMIGCAVFFVVALLAWLGDLCTLTRQYRTLGYVWLRALRLVQADIEDERIRQQQQQNPYYRGELSWFAATAAEREAWTQNLAPAPASDNDPSAASPEGELSWRVVAILIVGAIGVVTLLLWLLP